MLCSSAGALRPQPGWTGHGLPLKRLFLAERPGAGGRHGPLEGIGTRCVGRLPRKRPDPFHAPGTQTGSGRRPPCPGRARRSRFRSDVLATSGLDDRTSSHGIVEEAQALMAEAVGADHAFFSTCGSSLSVKSAMLSVAGPHEKLLVGRDAHKSVVSGLILSGIQPVWVDPQWDAERHLAHPPTAEAFEAAFEAAFAEHPDARGALVTTPTPYGTCSDLAAIAEVCHRRGRPLIVDEAWGAHLPFHRDLPTWAMDAGADVCVTSVHKMGSGLEQSSVFHLQGDLVKAEVLKSREDLLGTTSPSVLMRPAFRRSCRASVSPQRCCVTCGPGWSPAWSCRTRSTRK
ncbi:aminotransferase class I/II-fold pyridoxal phosphate-dependent enzyme [Streptomyces sp. NPDC058674]|uniref:aminotransferase class I/II-fold pyridoxal phosphate-dependent enzyme n=1 Tax=Streptomyces sp. NPDC058674 TaxID=3346592 RepID=UPI0036615431